jgi:hypothetical protein
LNWLRLAHQSTVNQNRRSQSTFTSKLDQEGIHQEQTLWWDCV